MLVAARSLQNSERCVCTVGSTPHSSAKPLSRFELVRARSIPIWAFTRWTNFRLTLGAPARHPFVFATIAAIAFLLDRDQRHDATIPR